MKLTTVSGVLTAQAETLQDVEKLLSLRSPAKVPTPRISKKRQKFPKVLKERVLALEVYETVSISQEEWNRPHSPVSNIFPLAKKENRKFSVKKIQGGYHVTRKA